MIRLAAMLACLLLAAPAAADSLISTLDGTWRGQGWGIARPGAAREAVRCRIRGTVAPTGLSVDFAGQCASPGARTIMNGKIERHSDGTYSGRWSNPRGLGTLGLNGRRTGNRINFRYRATDPDTGKQLTGTMAWTIGTDRIRLTGTVKEEGSATQPSTDITFTR